MPITNDRLLKVLSGQPVDRTPVWIMRQAGRYLPEYRALRQKVGSFLGLCQNPALAAEVTCQPLARFELDAAIIFADILLIPDAMGAGLNFVPGEGPRFKTVCQSQEAIQRLREIDAVADLGYVLEAIERVKSQISVPLLGFCGSPWTVATYMVEGGSTKDFRQIKRLLYSQPKVLMELLDRLVSASIEYCVAQVRAGADAIMIFDTWGGVLTPFAYQEFSLNPMDAVLKGIKALCPTTPVILFTKGGGIRALESLVQTGCQGVGLDWQTSLLEAKKSVGERVALQGNVDPSCLYAPPSQIELSVLQTLEAYGNGHRHILNLGHGIHQDINPEHVQAFVEAAHRHSPQYHQ
jgi:uroporphyrinogen decarboxylase